jgi:hypothetical protein
MVRPEDMLKSKNRRSEAKLGMPSIAFAVGDNGVAVSPIETGGHQ